MVCKPIKLGKNVCMGVRSVVAPGARIPDDTYLGPLSSSYELQDAHKDNKNYCRPTFAAPSMCLQVMVGWPIQLFVGQ